MADLVVDIPTYDVFVTELRRSFPDGDLVKTYNRIKYYIENEQFCADGTPITYRFIMDKYSSHIKQWNKRWKKKEDDGFLSKEASEQRKTLWDFIGMKWYEREFIIVAASSERDKYIFGEFSTKYLIEKLSEFKSQFINGK